ncbi:Fur family transcriptional regulator [Marinobacterium jannaschii]|uniref:Fur family transcriptional regulator n=1 Tax=Marinobacterium jannaschii TaxID=64970 RepID=UPI0004875675|nr:Fur family transcriptional regulator [Marinobacterium jannaschii]
MHSDQIAFHSDHNHQHCIDTALQEARTLCRARKQRLTPIRELVLKLIWQSHKPLGAYEILPTLAEAGFNSAPPTVYRALDFLQEQGLVHRIASLNAFIGCPHPEHQHQGSFLICSLCNTAQEIEIDEAAAQINAKAEALGFKPQQQMLEVLGICPNCQKGEER